MGNGKKDNTEGYNGWKLKTTLKGTITNSIRKSFSLINTKNAGRFFIILYLDKFQGNSKSFRIKIPSVRRAFKKNKRCVSTPVGIEFNIPLGAKVPSQFVKK